MYYWAVCESALKGYGGKPRTPRAHEFAWGEAEHHRHEWHDYTREEVFEMARLWAFEKINRSVVWLEIYNGRDKMVYGKFARITKREREKLGV